MIDPQSGQASQRLVVLDFSGTLSIAAVRFGQPASIESAVQECDLADQGIDGPLLWSEIILPSWHEAIATRRGYEGVLTDGAMTVLSARGRPTDRVADSIAAFTRRCLAANRIAPEWRPWLRRFTTLRDTKVIVATERAAEATAQISSELTARRRQRVGCAGERHRCAMPGRELRRPGKPKVGADVLANGSPCAPSPTGHTT